MITREEMMNDVIRRYGFEHPWVVKFCEFCDTWENEKVYNDGLESLYIALMTYTMPEEEEEQAAAPVRRADNRASANIFQKKY